MSKIVLLFPFSTALFLLCLSDGEVRIQASIFLKMRLREEEKHSLCQVAQVHSFSVLFKLLNSCRLLETNFVHLCKGLRICINAQRVFIKLTKKGKKPTFMKNQQGFLLSNFCILLKGCYERESKQLLKCKVYNSYVLGKVNSPDICEVCSFPGLCHEL